MSALRTLPAILALFLGISAAQEQPVPAQQEGVKLEFLQSQIPALEGTLGDPQLGLELDEWQLVWHPGGRLFTSTASPVVYDESRVQVWVPPGSAEPPRCKGFLNVSVPWSISTRGDLLCARWHSEDDLEGSNASVYALPTFSCFRFADAQKLWTVTLNRGEGVASHCFSKDDSKILLVVYNSGQSILSVRDAATGREESRLPLDGAERGPVHNGRRICAWGSGFLLLRNPIENGSERLLQVRLNPLSIEKVPTPEVDDERAEGLCLSRDERRLVVYGGEGYQVLEYNNNRWTPALSGKAPPFLLGDSLRTVTISSNSRVLLVATESETRVIDLATGKVIKELSEGCRAAAFAPDDSSIAVAQHSGLGVLNPRTWQFRDPPTTQHDCPVVEVIALADNKTLISRDHKAFIVWDLPSRKPRAMLKPKRSEPFLGSPAFANDHREIIAGDSIDFLRWKLPDLTGPVPPQPVVIEGQPAFGGLPGQSEEGEQMSVFGDPAGRRFITVQGGNVGQLRSLDAPGTVKTLSALGKVPYLVEQNMAFLGGDKVAIFGAVQGLFHLDLVKDEQTTVPAPPKDGRHQGGWLQERRTYLTMGKELRIISAETGQVQRSLTPPDRQWQFEAGGARGFGAALSPDGKLAAARLSRNRPWGRTLGLWDVEAGSLLAMHTLPNHDAGCLTFSHDGKLLIVGHANTAISLLDVEKLKSGRASAGAEGKSAQQTPPKQESTKYSYALVTGEPKEPVADGSGHLWSFHADGSCAVEGRLPSFGVLRINGKTMTTKAARYLRRMPHGSFLRGQFVSHDGQVGEENTWVSRSLSYKPHLDLPANIVHAIDGLTNLAQTPTRLVVVFEVQFPADAKGLITGAGTRTDIPADGNFTLGAQDHWVAPAGSGKPGETVTAVRINNPSSPTAPRLNWNAGNQKLSLTYDVTIQPAETRWLAHAVSLVKRMSEGTTDIVIFPDGADIGFVVAAGNQAEGINFARPDLWKLSENGGFSGLLPGNMGWSSGQPKPKPESDGLGFLWEVRADGGRRGGLGATSIFTPWFNRQPAFFAAEKFTQAHVNGKLVMRPISFSTPDRSVFIKRNVKMTEDLSSTVWHDTYQNYGEQPAETVVSYLTTFRSPVITVWDALDRKHTPADVAGPAGGLGGACAFVLEGEQQPATLLAFHDGQAGLSPTLRWIGPQAVALDYTFKLDPKESAAILLGACQRPLTAFGGAEAAFADWLPLKVPPPPPMQHAQAKAEAPPAPVVNYPVPGTN